MHMVHRTFIFAAVLSATSFSTAVQAQNPQVAILATDDASLPDAPGVSQASTQQQTAQQEQYGEGQQTKRIFWIIPNFRSVSVDAKLPPLSKSEKVKLALQDSFDYSSFIYVGLLAGVQQLSNSTPEFRQGAAGYGRYYWHAFADNTDGNLQTEAIFPILTREDPRYYTLGRGGFAKRLTYSLGRLVITRTDKGNETFNISEIAGNAVGAGIANLYYPAQERTATKSVENWWLQIGLDGASNLLKEFWPDIAHKLFHQQVEIETTPNGK